MLCKTVIKRITTGLSYLLMIAVCIFFIIPLVVMISTSSKTMPETFTYPITLFPKTWQLTFYNDALTRFPFFNYLKNTVIITGSCMLATGIICPMVAYSLARIRWRLREPLFILTLAVMMIPYQVTMVPTYMVYTKLGFVGTYLPLILPACFGTPYFIFLLRQFFRGLPKDLEEAARIDGCSEGGIFLRVFLPLCRPGILTVVIFQMLNCWNDFNGPLIYLQKSSMYTLQLGLQQFKSQYMTDWAPMMAAAVMMSLPIIILFFFLQNVFIEGITFTGIKG